MIHCGALLVAALAPGARWAHAPSASRAAVPIPLVAIRACAAEGYTEGPTNYDEAEARGIELFQAGEHERAIRMFELAQTLPGDGVDYTREKSSGMIGSANASPNPRGLRLERFATAQQKLIAEYNIACCCAAMGDRPRAMGILRSYVSRIEAGDRLSEVDDMIAEPDLASVRSDLQTLRSEVKEEVAQQQGRGFFGSTIRDLADKVGVEWKDSPTPPPSTKAPPVRALETGMDGAMDGAKQAMEGAKKAAEGAKKAAEFLKGVADKFSKNE